MLHLDFVTYIVETAFFLLCLELMMFTYFVHYITLQKYELLDMVVDGCVHVRDYFYAKYSW